MKERNFLSRVINKHDIEKNWNKATNFIPKKGEIIVYDPDENYAHSRFKIGDDVTVVTDLPFGVISSWNDLEDKPFGEVVGVSDTITWDGVQGEDDIVNGGAYLHRVTDCTPTKEDMAGSLCVIVAQGNETSKEITADEWISESENAYYLEGGSVMVALADNVTISGALLPKKGVYFSAASHDGNIIYYIKSITTPNYEFTTTVVKKIDPKYLPEATLTAPNGTKYTLAVADDGTLSAVAVE